MNLSLKACGARVNQVWAAKITYMPMARRFLYLVAVVGLVHSKEIQGLSSGSSSDFHMFPEPRLIESVVEVLCRQLTVQVESADFTYHPRPSV
ncbi:MAG: hypothetical protein JO071_13005 [Deltaproteobacteria bacterium]|nr:hypothetical protein [Deltaproteobacteria bacterium]